MKILYLGGKTAGLIGLLTLLSKGHRPDLFRCDSDVEKIGRWNELDYSQTNWPDPRNYDLLVSVHGRDIVPTWVLNTLKYGGINLHPCLWKYKGKDPIRRALEAGETKFSVGAHRMTEKVDEGEVLVEKFIEPKLTQFGISDIYSHLYPLYSIVLSEALEKLNVA